MGVPRSLPEYDGTTDIVDFKRVFQRNALLSGWSELYQAKIIRTFLKDDPFELIQSLSELEKQNIDLIFEKLVDRYGKKKAIFTQFNELRPNHNETLMSFQTRLRKILDKIDLKLSDVDKDKLLKDRFINALPEKFKDFAMYNSPGLTLRQVMDNMDKIMPMFKLEEYDELETNNVQLNSNPQQISQFRQANRSPRRCFRCNKPNHIAKDCRVDLSKPTVTWD